GCGTSSNGITISPGATFGCAIGWATGGGFTGRAAFCFFASSVAATNNVRASSAMSAARLYVRTSMPPFAFVSFASVSLRSAAWYVSLWSPPAVMASACAEIARPIAAFASCLLGTAAPPARRRILFRHFLDRMLQRLRARLILARADEIDAAVVRVRPPLRRDRGKRKQQQKRRALHRVPPASWGIVAVAGSANAMLSSCSWP